MEKLEKILKFFEDFDWDLEEAFSENESRILCKDFYFLQNQWQLTRTEYEIAKVDPTSFLSEILSRIERLKKACQKGCDWIEMDSQLIGIYHFLQKKYTRLRGEEYCGLLQKRRDACAKGGKTSKSKDVKKQERAEQMYQEFKIERPDLMEMYRKNPNAKRPKTELKQKLYVLFPLSEYKDSDERKLQNWVKTLFETDGHLIKYENN